MFWRKQTNTPSKTYTKAVARLRAVSTEEVLRYIDNTHTHIGQLMILIRKSPPEEAHSILDEIEDSADLIRAAVHALRGSDK